MAGLVLDPRLIGPEQIDIFSVEPWVGLVPFRIQEFFQTSTLELGRPGLACRVDAFPYKIRLFAGDRLRACAQVTIVAFF